MQHRTSLIPTPILVLLFMLISWLMPGMVSTAHAQRFPFLIQPVSIDDLRDLAVELELSREQQAQMMSLYTRYQAEYEQLQEREVGELMDDGLAMGQSMGSWMGGSISIPPRKDIEDLLKMALDIYDKFNRIDSAYFDSINMLVIEEQLPALERARRRRKLSNYIMPHFMLASRFNEGIQFNILEWIDRTDLSPDQLAAIRQVTDSFETRMLYLVVQFQDDLLKIVDQVLDLVDELGLRDMDMQQMMELWSEGGMQDRLIVFFDENSKPIQKSVDKMGRLNLQTAMQIKDVLGEENWVQLTFEYADSSYDDATGGVQRADRRFGGAMKLDGVTEDQVLLLESAQADYRSRWLVLFPQVAEAFQDSWAYRTAEQLEGDVPGEHDERLERLEGRSEDLVASGDSSLRSILTDEQMELMDGEKKEAKPQVRWARGRSGSNTPDATTGRTYSLPMAPMEPVSVEQFSAWLGLQDVDASVLESLYDEYATSYESLSVEYDQRLTDGYSALETDQGWRERRKVRRALQAEMLPKLKEAEDAFFADMSMVLPPDTQPDLLDQIRVSHDRARRRQKIWNGNWSLRGSTEGTIDIGEIVLAIDPETLDAESHQFMIDVLIEYNAASMTDIDAIEASYDRVKSLEDRLWGEGEGDIDEDLRKRLYERWETGRSDMSAIAARMAKTNRMTYEGILQEIPEDRIMLVQDMYERKAYPDVFKDPWVADEQIDGTLALEGLSADQREQINDLALDYRSQYRDLTVQILEGAKSRLDTERSWPPSSESMKRYMKMEQLRYRRRQLNDQIRILLELQLTDQQVAMIPGLGKDWSGSEKKGS